MAHSIDMRFNLLILSAICLFSLVSPAEAKTYVLDPAKTTISFKVKNLFFNVKGSLDLLTGHCNIDLAENTLINTRIVMDTKSIQTGDDERDKSLKSKNYFYVDEYPKLMFQSTAQNRIDFSDAAQNVLSGILTIKGISRPIDLKISHLQSENQMGNISGTVHTSINRLNFNIGEDVPTSFLDETVKIKVEFTAKAVEQYYQKRKPLNKQQEPET